MARRLTAHELACGFGSHGDLLYYTLASDGLVLRLIIET